MAEESSQVLADLTGEEFVSSATTLFEEYRSAWQSEWSRLNDCENAYHAKHWDSMSVSDEENENKPVTPIIMSTVENLKADMADSYPQAIVQPEAPEDQHVAEIINEIINQNHDASKYRREYMKSCHDLLVSGWCCEEVGYDQEMNNGLGCAYIRNVDNHTILFDPQTRDIQLGRAIFKMSPVTTEWLDQKYPSLAGQWQTDAFTLEKDTELQYDDTKSILLVEVWFKQWIEEGEDAGHWVVHLAHIAGGQLLDDSRDKKPDGYFRMGEFPFVVTVLYERKNSMLGYGIADYFEQSQEDADRLDSIVLKNASMSARNKILNTEASGFDSEDLADWSKSVHEGVNVNGLTWFANPPLPAYILSQGESIRQRIREESGTNDFSRGNTTAGVTAASSIQALQEMASKRVRMICQEKMEDFKQLVRYEIEFEREFNVIPRKVTLTVDGQQVQEEFQASIMERAGQFENDNVPIEFMISIKVERENKWSQVSQNELVLQMVQLGMIQPAQGVELMNFEGKELVLSKSAQQNTQPDAEMEQALMEQENIDQQMAELGIGQEEMLQ